MTASFGTPIGVFLLYMLTGLVDDFVRWTVFKLLTWVCWEFLLLCVDKTGDAPRERILTETLSFSEICESPGFGVYSKFLAS